MSFALDLLDIAIDVLLLGFRLAAHTARAVWMAVTLLATTAAAETRELIHDARRMRKAERRRV